MPQGDPRLAFEAYSPSTIRDCSAHKLENTKKYWLKECLALTKNTKITGESKLERAVPLFVHLGGLTFQLNAATM